MKMPNILNLVEVHTTCALCGTKVTQDLECMSKDITVFSYSCGCTSTHKYQSDTWKSKDGTNVLVKSTNVFPSIKNVVSLGFILGSNNFETAVHAWYKNLKLTHQENLKELIDIANIEIGIAIKLVGSLDILCEMPLQDVNIYLALGIDFISLYQELGDY